MNVISSFAFMFLYIVANGLAQMSTKGPPKFKDYPAKNIYRGEAAMPKFMAPIPESDITRIRNGVEKGWGVFHGFDERKGPNFAARFILVTWECGSPCMAMALVDAKTGEVYSPPIRWKKNDSRQAFVLPVLTYPDRVSQNPQLNFRLDSSLLEIKCNNGYEERPFTYYFLWQQNRWILLQRVPLKESG